MQVLSMFYVHFRCFFFCKRVGGVFCLLVVCGFFSVLTKTTAEF